MSKVLSILVFLASVFFMSGCGNGMQEKDADGFPIAQVLEADSIAIDEILMVEGKTLLKDYAVIYSPKTSKVLFRYRLPGWEFVDSSFVAGEGPDDFANAYLQKTNGCTNDLWISEPGRHWFKRYDLSDVTPRKVAGVPASSGYWIFSGTVCGDTLLVYGDVDFDEGEYYLRSAKLADSVRKADVLRCFSKSEIVVQTNGAGTVKNARIYNAPSIGVWGNRMLAWYGDTGSMLVYRISPDGHFHLENSFGELLTYEKVKNTDFKELKRDYREALSTVTQDYIYMIRVSYDGVIDQSSVTPRKKIALEVRVYDWEMKPIKKFVLDHMDADEVLVDELRGKIYAYDPRLDFEQVYVYDYDLK